MEKWFVAAKKADFNKIGDKFRISPVTARIIRNRDIIEMEEIEDYLYGDISKLRSGRSMYNMEQGLGLIKSKIKEGKKIQILGDYDIDGVNATQILCTGIKRCGGSVSTAIPNRMKDGYGINENLIQEAFDHGVDTIITCDNGIAAIDAIKFGKDLGMTIIVTDHHDIPYEEITDGDEITRKILRSAADAIINPKQEECQYPFKHLCGAGVAYKFIECLYEDMGIDKEELFPLLEFAAIATVGDVMDLVGENRIIVKEGLRRIKETKNLGIEALMEVNNIDKERLSSYHIGFVIGPCINASGRLDTAKLALKLLQAESKEEASTIAMDLKSLNDSRKAMTLEGTEAAIEQIETSALKNDKVLVVYLPTCHESLAGIIAGRIKERYHKPAFVLTDAEEGAKGSGRSIESYNMFEELVKCRDIFTKFGGHPMAAGLSLPIDKIGEMRERLNALTELSEEDFVPKVSIDVPMPIQYISESFIEELGLLEPFGKGNQKPVFAEKDLNIINARVLGKNKNVLKFQVLNQAGTMIEAMYFGDVQGFEDYIIMKYSKQELDKLYQNRENAVYLSFTYYPSVNEYNGRKSLQIIVQNYM